MDSVLLILNIMLGVLIFIIIILALVWYFGIHKSQVREEERERKAKEETTVSKTFNGVPRDDMFDFLDFDEIRDDMIIRKSGKQFVMVIQCKGVNYDLLSQEEKEAVEASFVAFLNTIRYPIQLYVQTRSLNLRKTIEGYNQKVSGISNEIKQLEARKAQIIRNGDTKELDRINFEIRRKQNILEYGQDISNYIGRMSQNQNVLQQKSYVVVSYYTSELGKIDDYSKDEIINMVFTELYTRAQTLIRTLSSCQVTGKILNSEELAELLYIAYNRDEEQVYQIDRAMESQYDALYSTAKDVLEKRKERLAKQLEDKAVDIASSSLLEADKVIKDREKLNNELRAKTMDIIAEYKNQLDPDLYNETKKIIEKKTAEEAKNEENSDSNLSQNKNANTNSQPGQANGQEQVNGVQTAGTTRPVRRIGRPRIN